MSGPLEPAVREWRRGEYTISTDRERLDFAVLHGFLSGESYWARGMPLEVLRRSIDNSLPFGLYSRGAQVGFARVVTDYAVFAYVGDVFVLADHRGRGLAKWLMEVMLSHPDLQGLRRWNLATRDAHGLYGRFGFAAAGASTMDRVDPDPYRRRT